jgi:hypothetical protein
MWWAGHGRTCPPHLSDASWCGARGSIGVGGAAWRSSSGGQAGLESPVLPAKRRPESRPVPRLGPYRGLVDRWLREDLQAPHKRRRTARRDLAAAGLKSTARRSLSARAIGMSRLGAGWACHSGASLCDGVQAGDSADVSRGPRPGVSSWSATTISRGR